MTYPTYPEGYFERAEGSNYRNYGDDPGWNVVVNVLKGLGVPAGSCIVEAACAKGYLVQRAVQGGYDARGFDISEYAISKAASGTADRIVVHNAAEAWPYADASADLVLSMEFLEHIFVGDIPAVLGETHRVLKAGGRVVSKIGLVVPEDHPFAGQEDHDHTHVTMRDRAWWNEQFVAAGFELTDADTTVVKAFDDAFSGRDWFGRFFSFTKVAA